MARTLGFNYFALPLYIGVAAFGSDAGMEGR
jgi:hypothetical protein